MSAAGSTHGAGWLDAGGPFGLGATKLATAMSRRASHHPGPSRSPNGTLPGLAIHDTTQCNAHKRLRRRDGALLLHGGVPGELRLEPRADLLLEDLVHAVSALARLVHHRLVPCSAHSTLTAAQDLPRASQTRPHDISYSPRALTPPSPTPRGCFLARPPAPALCFPPRLALRPPTLTSSLPALRGACPLTPHPPFPPPPHPKLSRKTPRPKPRAQAATPTRAKQPSPPPPSAAARTRTSQKCLPPRGRRAAPARLLLGHRLLLRHRCRGSRLRGRCRLRHRFRSRRGRPRLHAQAARCRLAGRRRHRFLLPLPPPRAPAGVA